MRVKRVVGNWKMNGSLASNQALVEAIVPSLDDRAHCAVCVPFPYLLATGQALRGTALGLGAQDLCQFDNGAYTGGVSAAMLVDCGCRYAIVGHSERRNVFGETDEIVAQKHAQAVKHGLIPILCVGEMLSARESGATERVVAGQLDAVLGRAGAQGLRQGVIAYEPVWAIGTGKTATPEQAQAVHAFIRERIARVDREAAEELTILYGGSVKAGNAAQLFAMPDVDGGLVGGASLDAMEFAAICRSAANAAR
jgi:triosephosphate isomerase